MMLSEDVPNDETHNRMVFNGDMHCIACGNKVSIINRRVIYLTFGQITVEIL